MIKLDTLVLIDFFDHNNLDKKIYDIEQQGTEYKKVARYLENLRIETGITDVVYSAYGSNYELNPNCTDPAFKQHRTFPPDQINRHALYSVEEKPELFKDKAILVAGNSFWSCVRQRDLGILNLSKSGVKSIWSSPGITGYYSPRGKTPEDIFKQTKKPIPYINATIKDFREDESFKWRKVELTDNHCIFKCDIINT